MTTPIPAIAVVIITYHGDIFVATAVQSVLAQTYRSFELVVVEDGSRGETQRIVESFGDDRVRYLWRPNGGLSAARNSGIAATRAPLVAFLDVDDWWHPDKLRAQVEALAGNPSAGAVYSSATRVAEGENGVRQLEVAQVSGQMLPRLLLGNCITGSASSIMVRRTALEQVDGFDESVKYSEDWDCWLRLAAITEFAISKPPHVFLLARLDSFGRNSNAMRRGCHEILDRALARYTGTTSRLQRESHANIEYAASIDFMERGHRSAAWGPLLRSLTINPLRRSAWKRLLLMLVGRL